MAQGIHDALNPEDPTVAKWLIVYATNDGHTRVVAERIGEVLRAQGHTAYVLHVLKLPKDLDLNQYDAAWVGGSLYRQRHQPALERFVRANVQTLNAMPAAFFSVSLSAAGKRPEQQADAQAMAQRFLDATGWKPRRVECVPGALLYRRYNFIIRFIMKRIAAKAGGDTDTTQNHDYTDWSAVENFTIAFAREIE
jgi:menaquinone-dependent protoporphyrinogen oxidase